MSGVAVVYLLVILRLKQKWTEVSLREYKAKMQLKCAAKAARLEEAERGQPTCKKLVAVITRWGTSSTLKNFAQPSDPLWQVLVQHEDGPGRLGSFRSQLLVTLKQALLQHPNAEARDLQGLRRHAKVIVLNGAPYADEYASCHMEWRPTMYVAGPTPYAALEVVRLVMAEKVRQGLLSQVPPELHVAWQPKFGKPPAEPLPSPWRAVDGLRPIPHQFEVQPPEAPRVREHLEGHFEQTSTSTRHPQMRLVLDVGITAFEKACNDAGILAPHPNRPYRLACVLDNLGMGDGGRHRVSSLLRQVLGGRPVQLYFNIPAGDAFKSWLQEQPSVVMLS